jgi:hypothetical protein
VRTYGFAACPFEKEIFMARSPFVRWIVTLSLLLAAALTAGCDTIGKPGSGSSGSGSSTGMSRGGY